MNIFAITSRGLEKVGEREINLKIDDCLISEVSYRKTLFSTNFSLNKLCELKTIEDIFILVGIVENIGHTQDHLNDLVRKVLNLDFTQALLELSKIREVKNFSISSSSVGKRNFSHIQVKEALNKPLERSLGLKFENELHEEFDIRILLEHGKGYVGVRISEKPLYRRSYKQATTPGSLKSNIAYSMCSLAEINETDFVLDPMCGSGTILAEAFSFSPLRVLGGDSSPEAVEVTKNNLANLGKECDIRLWDALNLPLESNSIDKVVTNLPFGKQVVVKNLEIDDFYTKSLQDVYRVLKHYGKAVFLTSEIDYLHHSVKSIAGLILENELEISLNGEIAYIVRVKKI